MQHRIVQIPMAKQRESQFFTLGYTSVVGIRHLSMNLFMIQANDLVEEQAMVCFIPISVYA
jgi:hypothetical protein